MKKLFALFLSVIITFSLCGCSFTRKNTLPLPESSMEFSFLSGAGAWRTVITLNSDGTFTGFYLDSEMGSMGENYPKGTAYTSTFSGEFTKIKKVNEFSYQMELTNLKTEKPKGLTWIEDEIKYIASEPYGFESGKNFIFYLPKTPINNLPEEFLSWWPYRYNQDTNTKSTLSTYGIRNTKTNYGFFSEE